MSKTQASTLIALAALVFWRSGPSFPSLFTKRDLPSAAFAYGSADIQCTQLEAPDFKFCEDATIWDVLDAKINTTHQYVLVSCDAGRKAWNTVLGPLRDPEPKGSLWLVSDGQPRRLALQGFPKNHTFHPLGLAIWPSDGKNPSNLFVVNHARERTVIEQFTLAPAGEAMKHIRTIVSPYFASPNSIALTSPHSFYVTNDHLMTRRLPIVGHVLPVIETFLALPLGWVSHVSVDPNPDAAESIIKSQPAALFVPFANGVSVSPSGLQVAVASTSLSAVRFYSRNAETNALKYQRSVILPFLPDNLEYDSESKLVVAGHAHFPSLLQVKADPTSKATAPSWISVIAPDYSVETVFQSDGTVFSSSSTGLRSAEGILYATGLYSESGLLMCQP
ncbi:unnamed protein product [Mycena citricolor]|uniref:Arylesterase n=1 Tax=Mycena citricolor TaxID=2018698 RepID=A0AAD2I005_9AGAR|nr:unnamed protein product [Mycena citricolor]